MAKIATHDSATGEKSKNWLHALGKVFAQTQIKTIKEQYEVGVRYFDLRVNRDLVLCHGLWKANKDLADILIEMRKYVTETTYVTVTIERGYSDEEIDSIANRIRKVLNLYGGMTKLVYIARKKPYWSIIKEYRKVACVSNYLSVPTPKEYLTLPYADWRRYIPIPRILKKITPSPQYDPDIFTMVDFV